jgi:hypothetical protein
MLPVYASAQSTYLPRNINPGGPMIPAGQDPFRLCYYRGVAYSEGAVAKADNGKILQCDAGDSLRFGPASKQPLPSQWQPASK